MPRNPLQRLAEARSPGSSRWSRPSAAAPDGDRTVATANVITVRTLVESAILILSLIATLMVLARLADIILLFLIAIVLAEGIRPLVHRLERLHLPRIMAIAAVMVLLLGGTAAVIALLVRPIVTEAQSLAADLPVYQRQATATVNDVQSRLHLSSDLGGQVSNTLNAAKDVLLAVGVYIVNFLIDFVVVLVLAFLWLTTSDRLKIFFVDLFPTRYEPLVADILRDIGFRMGGYLRAVAMNAVVVGVAAGLACVALRLPSPLLLGIFVALTSVIPLVGPFAGALPAVLLGFTIGPLYPLLVAAVFTAIMLVDGNTVVPLVMNRVLSIPALGVVLSLLIGAALGGLAGALLAVPLAAAIQILIVRAIVPAVHQSQGRSGGLIEAAQAIAAAKARPPGTPERRRARRA